MAPGLGRTGSLPWQLGCLTEAPNLHRPAGPAAACSWGPRPAFSELCVPADRMREQDAHKASTVTAAHAEKHLPFRFHFSSEYFAEKPFPAGGGEPIKDVLNRESHISCLFRLCSRLQITEFVKAQGAGSHPIVLSLTGLRSNLDVFQV